MDIDLSELQQLADSLEKVPQKALPGLRRTVQDSARRLRDEMRRDATGHRFLPHFPRSITYETRATPGGIDAEVGPDSRRTQGPLAPVLYFGTSNTGPVLDLNGPVDREEPRFIKAVGDAAGDPGLLS